MLIACLYVDDLLFTGNNQPMFDEFKKAMFKEFEMTDGGLMSFFLGIEVKQQHGGIYISQKKYAKELLEKFKMTDCNAVNTHVATGLKLTKKRRRKKRGLDSVQESDWKPKVPHNHKAGYRLQCWASEQVHGSTKRITLASRKKNPEVHQMNNEIWSFLSI